MNRDKTQRIVLSTGSNKGIGLETVRQLARRGFHVIIAARDEGKGRQAAETIQAASGKATFLSLDTSGSDSIRSAARQLSAIAGHLDVLINNAAIYPDQGVPISTLPRDRLVQTFQTNIFGPLNASSCRPCRGFLAGRTSVGRGRTIYFVALLSRE